LESSVANREERTRLRFNIPPPVKVPEGGISTFEVFIDVPAEVLAEQLTICDFNIFSDLRSKELLNQSWNKQKLKHRSPNVMNLIQRSTKLSMWVASLIIYADRNLQRSKNI